MNYNTKIDYIIVDGMSYLYRAYYAFLNFKNKENQPSGAIYGVLNMLRSLLLKYPITKIIIVFDSHQKTFRNDLFPLYKKNRKRMPDNLQLQIKPLYKIIRYIGLPILNIPYFEADDIIGTIIKKINKNNKLILISTNDKDLAQLVTVNINILEPISHKILGEKLIEKKFGIKPKFIPDLFGLMGDTSDNIPGVPQIGKKTALILLKNFKSLENIYKNIECIPQFPFRGAKNLHSKLVNHKKLAFLSKKLATIEINVPIRITKQELKMTEPSIYKMFDFFKKYNFKRWLELLNKQQWFKKKSEFN